GGSDRGPATGDGAADRDDEREHRGQRPKDRRSAHGSPESCDGESCCRQGKRRPGSRGTRGDARSARTPEGGRHDDADDKEVSSVASLHFQTHRHWKVIAVATLPLLVFAAESPRVALPVSRSYERVHR